MSPLQERAQAFLQLPIPAELAPNFMSGSLAETMITSYVAGNTLEDEAVELLGIAAIESDAAAEEYKTPEAKAYFKECCAILSAIENEIG